MRSWPNIRVFGDGLEKRADPGIRLGGQHDGIGDESDLEQRGCWDLRTSSGWISSCPSGITKRVRPAARAASRFQGRP